MVHLLRVPPALREPEFQSRTLSGGSALPTALVLVNPMFFSVFLRGCIHIHTHKTHPRAGKLQRLGALAALPDKQFHS